MVLGTRRKFELEVDGTYMVGSPFSLVFFKTGMVADTSRHFYGRSEGFKLNLLGESSGNFCSNPETGKVQ